MDRGIVLAMWMETGFILVQLYTDITMFYVCFLALVCMINSEVLPK